MLDLQKCMFAVVVGIASRFCVTGVGGATLQRRVISAEGFRDPLVPGCWGCNYHSVKIDDNSILGFHVEVVSNPDVHLGEWQYGVANQDFQTDPGLPGHSFVNTFSQHSDSGGKCVTKAAYSNDPSGSPSTARHICVSISSHRNEWSYLQGREQMCLTLHPEWRQWKPQYFSWLYMWLVGRSELLWRSIICPFPQQFWSVLCSLLRVFRRWNLLNWCILCECKSQSIASVMGAVHPMSWRPIMAQVGLKRVQMCMCNYADSPRIYMDDPCVDLNFTTTLPNGGLQSDMHWWLI